MSSKMIILILLVAAAVLFIIPALDGGKMAFVSGSFILLPAWLGCLILLALGYFIAVFMRGKR